MAAQGIPGTGTPGVNQDGATGAGGPTATGARTPGEVIFTGQDAAHSATAGPQIDQSFVDNFVHPVFDLAVKAPLRDRLIWDQFVTWKPSGKLGEKITAFLGDDIDEAGSDVPLLENLDVDSVTFGAWNMEFKGDEYGRAVSRTRLANAKTAINIDPMIVDRVAWDAARGVDKIAQKAIMDPGTGALKNVLYSPKYGTAGIAATPAKINAQKFLDTSDLQMGVTALELRNVLPFRNGNYVLLCNPQGAQHLKNERDTGGFRYVTARNEGAGGNSIYNGTIGLCEGVDVVVSNRVPVGKAYLIGQDAIAKTNLNSEGYSDNPSTVVAPVIDKLRRFLSWGWLHYVGYAPYDVRSMIEYTYTEKFRPAGAAGLDTAAVGTDIAVAGTGAGAGAATANALAKYLTFGRAAF
jgi:hypothetical protein